MTESTKKVIGSFTLAMEDDSTASVHTSLLDSFFDLPTADQISLLHGVYRIAQEIMMKIAANSSSDEEDDDEDDFCAVSIRYSVGSTH